MNKIEQSLDHQEWYKVFLEELKAILVEKGMIIRDELIHSKWLLGKRIVEEQNLKTSQYGENIVEKIADGLGISPVSLWKCIQFYKKFPLADFDDVITKFPKNVSWYHITLTILPKHKQEVDAKKKLLRKQEECPHSKLKCTSCKKELSLEQAKKL